MQRFPKPSFISAVPIATSRWLPSIDKDRCRHDPSLRRSSTSIGRRPIRAVLPSLAVAIPALRLPASPPLSSPFALLTTLLISSSLPLLCPNHPITTSLTPPVVTTLICVLLSNTLLIPTQHPLYSLITSYLVPLSVPLLLFSADLRRVLRETGRLLIVFLVGSIATVIGTLFAASVLPLTGDAWKVAAALCARHIGGAVNYVAVVDALKVDSAMITAGLAADNVVMPLYFTFVLYLSRSAAPPTEPYTKETESEDTPNTVDDESASNIINLQHALRSLCISGIICSFAVFLTRRFSIMIGPIPIITIIVVFLATVFPSQFSPYSRTASSLGFLFMQMFFAVAGAGGSVLSVIRNAPVLIAFSALQVTVHLAVLLGVGKLFRSNKAEVLLASNANVGGPSTAAAMAATRDWKSLVVPALLVGVLGYSMATFVSLALGYAFLKPP